MINRPIIPKNPLHLRFIGNGPEKRFPAMNRYNIQKEFSEQTDEQYYI